MAEMVIYSTAKKGKLCKEHKHQRNKNHSKCPPTKITDANLTVSVCYIWKKYRIHICNRVMIGFLKSVVKGDLNLHQDDASDPNQCCNSLATIASWWLNQPVFETYDRQNGFIFPKVRGENKTYLKPPPRLCGFSKKNSGLFGFGRVVGLTLEATQIYIFVEIHESQCPSSGHKWLVNLDLWKKLCVFQRFSFNKKN